MLGERVVREQALDVEVLDDDAVVALREHRGGVVDEVAPRVGDIGVDVLDSLVRADRFDGATPFRGPQRREATRWVRDSRA